MVFYLILTLTIVLVLKMSLNFDHNSNLSRKKVSHYGKIVKMCQFYFDSSRSFAIVLATQTVLLDHPVDYYAHFDFDQIVYFKHLLQFLKN
jgi:hypothetical protein